MFERLAPEQHDTLEGVPEPAETPFLMGHEEAAAMLVGAYRAGKLPHALMFVGPVGIGKATLAFHLAHHLLKHPRHQESPAQLAVPDPASPLFRQIAQGAHPSVLHLTRPLNERTKAYKSVVTVDEIRKVSSFLSLTSHDGGYRVVIVDPADDMNTNAANALLKNLEEPPTRTLFILIVHAPGSLLPTIRSRCQVVRLSPLTPQSLGQVMEAVGQGTGDDSLLSRAGGSVRNAILLPSMADWKSPEHWKTWCGRRATRSAQRTSSQMWWLAVTVPFLSTYSIATRSICSRKKPDRPHLPAIWPAPNRLPTLGRKRGMR